MSVPDRVATVLGIGGAGGALVLGVTLARGGASGAAVIGAAGSLASVVGLLAVAVQLIGVQRATTASATAARETRDSIHNLFALADVARTIKLLEQIQNDVGTGKFEVARVRLQDARATLIQFQPAMEELGGEDSEAFRRLLLNTSVDLANLFTVVHGNGKLFNAPRFARGIEELIALLLKAERHIKREA